MLPTVSRRREVSPALRPRPGGYWSRNRSFRPPDRIELAELPADIAAVAEERVDERLPLLAVGRGLPLDGGTADLHACLAARAVILVDREDESFLVDPLPFHQDTGAVGDDHRRFRTLHL